MLTHAFNMVVSGPSGSGKTQFIKRLIEQKDKLITPNIKKTFFAYTEFQDAYTEIDAEFIGHIPDINEIEPFSLLILDDFQDRVKLLENLFTKHSHHRNISVIILVQNPFAKDMRTISLNAHYFVFMRNPRDNSQINYLARQINPAKSKNIIEAYQDATKSPYSYLFIDLKQETPEQLRFRTDIFDEDMQRVYLI